MSVIDTLIFDRTQNDVTNGTKKGYYNSEDFNRVIEAMKYSAGVLNAAGYALAIHSAPNWSDTSIPCQDDAQTYLEDLRTIHDALDCQHEIDNPRIVDISVVNGPDGVGNGGIQAVPGTLEYLMWHTVNTIERILLRVNQGYKNMLASVVPCGAATSGGDYL